jgi:MSHA pilin protein MshC
MAAGFVRLRPGAGCGVVMSRTDGFTLVELVAVIIIVAILAVVAIPRMFNPQDFQSRAFYDQTTAALRFAQKAAVAQRRTVCVAFGTASVTFTVASNAGTANCTPGVGLVGPDGKVPYQISATGGIVFAAVPVDFNFNALGQASTGQVIQFTGGAPNLTVVQDSGYVY